MGKSFVSFYTPPPTVGVRWAVGRFTVSQQLITDMEVAAQRELDGLLQDLVDGWAESNRNGHIGPRHRPTRDDLRDIQRAEWTRRRNRENVAALGRPAGQFRRAPFCDGHRVPCPLGLNREFFDDERGGMHCVECPT